MCKQTVSDATVLLDLSHHAFYCSQFRIKLPRITVLGWGKDIWAVGPGEGL